jgi:hypothetical protein
MDVIAGSLAPLLALGAVVLVPVVLARALLGRADLANLYRAEGDGWPRGVQEEESRPWRFTARRPPREGPGGADADDAFVVGPGPPARVHVGRPERAWP